MARASASSLRQYQDISIQNQTKTIHDQISGSGLGHFYRFRLTNRSSIDLTLKRQDAGPLNLELISDRNGNSKIDNGDVIATSRSPRKQNRIKFSGLDDGEYFVRIYPDGRKSPTYELKASAETKKGIDPAYQMLLWTNKLRRQNDLSELSLNTQLTDAAKGHSRSMAEFNFFSHTGKDGSQPGDRILDANYRYAKASENIAMGAAKHRAAFDAWASSTADKANLLDPAYKEMGLGYARSNTGKRYWTQTFGDPTGTLSAGSGGSSQRWTGSFINRTSSNYKDYKTYDFSKPDVVLDLGGQGKKGSTVARLKLDYGLGSPDSKIQNSRFAMEAWTRIPLEAGRFYQVTSKSDDGTRFYVKSAATQKKLADIGGDWQNRSASDPAWKQTFTVSTSGNYDFYVQYYEDFGASIVDVKIEQLTFKGQVASSVNALNVRSRPSTLNNTAIKAINGGTSFTVLGKVNSPDDTTYKQWYEIQLSDGTKGYVVADNSLVNVSGAPNSIVNINDPNATQNPIGGGDNTTDPNPIPTGTGYISPRVLKTSGDTIPFRSDNSLDSTVIAQLGANTPLKILGKETGDYYLDNRFDEWYRVSTTINGQVKEGYVAAYYVDVPSDGKTFSSAISKTNPYYKSHLEEAEDPYYYTSSYKPFIEEAAALYSWLSPSIIAGIGSRESGWGLFLSPKGPTGTGDGGHGRGLMQIDDRYHKTFINSGQWTNPRANIMYGVKNVLGSYYDYFDRTTNLSGVALLRSAIAAYNAGPGNVDRALSEGRDVDYYTTGQDYSWDVLNRAGYFQLNGWT